MSISWLPTRFRVFPRQRGGHGSAFRTWPPSALAAHLLRLQTTGGADVSMLGSRGALSGIQIALIGGRNGIGRAVLRYDTDGLLSWRAPGSATPGTGVDVSGGGDFWLADGDDSDKWVKVTVTVAYLPNGASSAVVQLADEYNNEVANDDYVAGAAASEHTLALKNTHIGSVENVTAWLDPDCAENRGLTIKPAGGSAEQPWNETEGRADFGEHQIAAGGTLNVTFNRTPDAAGQPRQFVRGFVKWDDRAGGHNTLEFRGLFRVYDAAESYEAYQDDADNPVPGLDTPYATSGSLPFTPADTFGNATHRLCLVRKNRFGLRSASRRIDRIYVSGGVGVDPPPTGPDAVKVSLRPDGKVRVWARYAKPSVAARTATQWAIWYTTDGSAPGGGDPDYTPTVKWLGMGRGALLVFDGIPAQSAGTQVRVLVKMRSDSPGDSSESIAESGTIPASGPSGPEKLGSLQETY